MSDDPGRTNLGRGWKFARSKRSLGDGGEGYCEQEKQANKQTNKVRAQGGFTEIVRRSMH